MRYSCEKRNGFFNRIESGFGVSVHHVMSRNARKVIIIIIIFIDVKSVDFSRSVQATDEIGVGVRRSG